MGDNLNERNHPSTTSPEADGRKRLNSSFFALLSSLTKIEKERESESEFIKTLTGDVLLLLLLLLLQFLLLLLLQLELADRSL